MTAMITPVRVCLIDDDHLHYYYIIDLIFDIFFGLDIVVNFTSSFYDQNNQLIFKFDDIIKRYLQGWFFIDIISIFPFDSINITERSIVNGSSSYQKLLRLLRLPRLYRLTKIIKLSREGSSSFLHKLSETYITIGVKQILNILFVMLLMVHLAAVFFYFTAR